MRDSKENLPESDESFALPLKGWHYALLAVPYASLLLPFLYARWSPEFNGIPFFYTYQFGWVFLSAGLTAIVYRSIRR